MAAISLASVWSSASEVSVSAGTSEQTSLAAECGFSSASASEELSSVPTLLSTLALFEAEVLVFVVLASSASTSSASGVAFVVFLSAYAGVESFLLSL